MTTARLDVDGAPGSRRVCIDRGWVVIGEAVIDEREDTIGISFADKVLSVANLLAAQETSLVAAGLIVPSLVQVCVTWEVKNKSQTLFMAHGWFPACPECDVPRSAVDPLPRGLLFGDFSSEPNPVMSTFCHLLQNVVFESVIDHGGQMTSLLLAEVLGSSPVFGVVAGAQVVTVSVVFFPAIFARVDALIFRAASVVISSTICIHREKKSKKSEKEANVDDTHRSSCKNDWGKVCRSLTEGLGGTGWYSVALGQYGVVRVDI